MIQLSAPSPDLMPVQDGKSSEKAPGLTKESDGFKTVLRKEKESREAVGSGEVAGKKGRTADEARSEQIAGVEKSATKGSSERAESPDTLKKTVLKILNRKPESGVQNEVRTLFAKKNGTSIPVDFNVHEKAGLMKKSMAGAQIKTVKSENNEKKTVKAPVPADGKSLAAGLQTKEIQDEIPVSDGKARLTRADSSEVEENQVFPVNQTALPLSQAVPQVLNVSDTNGKNTLLQKDKKKSEEGAVKITVEDKRTVTPREKAALMLKEVETGESPNKVTLELVPQDDLSGMISRGDQGDGTGRNFVLQAAEEQKGAALLDRQLQDRGTQELTKNIKFVLKDHNEGEIRLILKPEALGKVRINLNLHENNIVGKIIVENNSVRQAFMNNLADLTKALEDSGFNSASLDVSVGGGQTQSRQRDQDEQPVYFNDSSISSLEDQIPVVYEQGAALSQINMMV